MLRGRIGACAAKPPTPPSNDRLRGAFWTNPESWRAPAKMA
jgi:putative transposase